MNYEDKTEPVRLPLDDGQQAPDASPKARGWISRTYEFAAPETAFVFLFYVVATSQVAGRWPEVRYQRCQVEIGDSRGQLFDQLEADAARLGGHRVGTIREER